MINQIYDFMISTTGINLISLLVVFKMIIRGILVYFFGISLARFNKKLMSIHTPFNFILFVMLGSIFAVAIIDEKIFLPLLITTLILVIINGIITMLSFYYPSVELFIKGSPSILVKNGEIQWSAMKKNFITKRELLNELTMQLQTNNLEKIETATLESDGSINFITKKYPHN